MQSEKKLLVKLKELFLYKKKIANLKNYEERVNFNYFESRNYNCLSLKWL